MNSIRLTGVGIESSVFSTDTGDEAIKILLTFRAKGEPGHILVESYNPQVVNRLRSYCSRNVLFVCGTLCERDGGVYIIADNIDFAQPRQPSPKNFNPVVKPLPTEKFAR